MDYTEEQITVALDKAQETINSRSGETVRGYNCCWGFVIEYDKELRGGHSPISDLGLRFNSPEEFEGAVAAAGFKDFKELATSLSYLEIKNKRPKMGDVAYCITADGCLSAIIAGKSRWLTSTGSTGIKNLHQWSFIERRIPLITRPQRS